MPITLSTPFELTGPNTPGETDLYAAPMGLSVDQVQNTMTFTVYPSTAQAVNGSGNVTGITPGTIPPVSMTINAQNGAWRTSWGTSGWLTGAALTGAQAWLAAGLTPTMKNQAEAAWIAMAIFPGTQTPWQT